MADLGIRSHLDSITDADVLKYMQKTNRQYLFPSDIAAMVNTDVDGVVDSLQHLREMCLVKHVTEGYCLTEMGKKA